MGSETMPIPLSTSRYQAEPRPEMFLAVICLSGLKCWASKVRPLSSQLLPSAASEATRASVTSPDLAGVSADERRAKAAAMPRHITVTDVNCQFFMMPHLTAKLNLAKCDFPHKEMVTVGDYTS